MNYDDYFSLSVGVERQSPAGFSSHQHIIITRVKCFTQALVMDQAL
jgi:hypothetical protein